MSTDELKDQFQTTEFWLIEAATSEAVPHTFFGIVDGKGGWTTNSWNALRLSREQDAKAIVAMAQWPEESVRLQSCWEIDLPDGTKVTDDAGNEWEAA